MLKPALESCKKWLLSSQEEHLCSCSVACLPAGFVLYFHRAKSNGIHQFLTLELNRWGLCGLKFSLCNTIVNNVVHIDQNRVFSLRLGLTALISNQFEQAGTLLSAPNFRKKFVLYEKVLTFGF